MASWMVHLRIADKLLEALSVTAPVEFIVGNLAPDSGVPNEDWSAFDPPYATSHFKTGTDKAGPEAFAEKYFRPEQRQSYSDSQFAFYLGYLSHLITDRLWSEKIARPTLKQYAKEDAPDREQFIWQIKEDWYDLDYKYLRDHPGFRAFRVYLGAVGFRNDFMEEFSEDAFDNRRIYITDFYLQGKENLDREYPYLTEAAMDAFVEEAVREISNILHRKYNVKL